MQKKVYLFSISSHPKAISVNSLDIQLLKPDINFSQYDYFILTSKQASKAIKQYKDADLKPALCVSTQTALSYESINGEVLDIGAGYGDTLVEKIKKYPKATKWLYLRAKVIASDFISSCHNDGYSIDEVIIYESQCSKEIKNTQVEDNSILIFTSPSSVKCFLKHHSISLESTVIVIGKTTAKALPITIKYQLSSEKTIQSCFDLLPS